MTPNRVAKWRALLTQPLTPEQSRGIRRQIVLLPVCMYLLFVWTMFALNISTPGRLDQAGLIKGHDFVHFYVLGQIALDRAPEELYDFDAQAARADRLAPPGDVRFRPIHPPQVALAVAPLALLPYGAAVAVWLLLTAAAYAGCCYALWAAFPALTRYWWLGLLLAVANPSFYAVIAFGQNSAVALAVFTTAYFALSAGRPWLAGLALGLLFYKPTLALALPFVVIYGREWRVVSGAATSILLQLAVASAYFGTDPLLAYAGALAGTPEVAALHEPMPFQMQSLRSFFSLLLPWPRWALACYFAASAAAVTIAAVCWRAAAPLELRYGVLVAVSLLVNPHVNPYELLPTAVVFILTAGWALGREAKSGGALWTLLYLAYCLPAFALLSEITRVQASVVALTALTLFLARPARLSAGVPALPRPSPDR